MISSSGVDSLVNKFNDARQKGLKSNATNEDLSPLESLVADVIKKAKERLLNHEGTSIQKAESLQELLFLQTQGVSVNWADFAISEIMMTDNYSVKLMAYLSASQFWEPEGDVIMMVTQCINKDLTGPDKMKKSLALTLIPIIATSQFAESVVSNVSANFTSQYEEIRQKSITCFFKLCLKFPECLPAGIKAMNIKQILADRTDSPGVICSILSLINELVYHCPSTFKTLLPTLIQFFQEAGGSPWILVRALSIVSNVAVTLEKQALEKFNNKITTLISELLNSTSAPSVIYEVIRLVCTLKMSNREIIRTAAERAQSFIINDDPNLKYLGLISMTRLMKLNPSIIQLHSQVLQDCLGSEDETCLFIAVDLLESVVTRKTIGNIVLSLVDQVESRKEIHIREALVQRIISICKYGEESEYERFTDYEWYVNVLLTLHSYGIKSKILSDELLTMAMRAKITRPTLVSEMIDYMMELNPNETEFIETAAFIIGEYSLDEIDTEEEDFQETQQERGFKCLLSDLILRAKPSAQAACLQNAFKIYAKSQTKEEMQQRSAILLEKLPLYSTSRFTEVQERATMLIALVNIFSESNDIEALTTLYTMPLPAVDPSAQSKVMIPASLDIATPIIELDPKSNGFDLDFEEDNFENDSFSFSHPFNTQPKHHNLLHSKKEEPKEEKTEQTQQDKKKNRRLLLKSEPEDVLLPCEGEIPLSQQKVITEKADPLAKVDINSKVMTSLPEVKPYSQNELLKQQNRSTLSKKRILNPSIVQEDIFKQIGQTEGISIMFTQIIPNEKGELEIHLDLSNQSTSPISVIEFNLDDLKPQILKQEIQPQEIKTITLFYKNPGEIMEPRIVKVSVIPTGGSGEVIRGKLRISPTLYLKKSESDKFLEFMNVCNSQSSIEIPIDTSITQTINKYNSVIKGTIVKESIDGKKVIALLSNYENVFSVVALISPICSSSLSVVVKSSQESVTKAIIEEIKSLINH